MLLHLLAVWRRWRHLLLDQMHFEHHDAPLDAPLRNPPSSLPGESVVERRAREEKLHAIRDGHSSAPLVDPTRHLHLVDRGGMPPDDD